jgi:hypothetical protein
MNVSSRLCSLIYWLSSIYPIDFECALDRPEVTRNNRSIGQHIKEALDFSLSSGKLAFKRGPSLVQSIFGLLLLLSVHHIKWRLEFLNFIGRFICYILSWFIGTRVLSCMLRRLLYMGRFERVRRGWAWRMVCHDHRFRLAPVNFV